MMPAIDSTEEFDTLERRLEKSNCKAVFVSHWKLDENCHVCVFNMIKRISLYFFLKYTFIFTCTFLIKLFFFQVQSQEVPSKYFKISFSLRQFGIIWNNLKDLVLDSSFNIIMIQNDRKCGIMKMCIEGIYSTPLSIILILTPQTMNEQLHFRNSCFKGLEEQMVLNTWKKKTYSR